LQIKVYDCLESVSRTDYWMMFLAYQYLSLVEVDENPIAKGLMEMTQVGWFVS
jgi:hypothetical protein